MMDRVLSYEYINTDQKLLKRSISRHMYANVSSEYLYSSGITVTLDRIHTKATRSNSGEATDIIGTECI
jgi:hypothetical protein